MQKRGQISGELFLYILGLVVVALIVYFGYKSYSGLRQNKEDYDLIQLKTQLKNDIESGKKYGNINIKTYNVPTNFNEVCFVDLKQVNNADIADYPLIKDSVAGGENKNVFFLGKGYFEAILIEDMQLVAPFFSCVNVKQGRIEIRIEGQGDSSLIKTPPSEIYCKTAQDKGWCSSLDIIYYSGSKSECCKDYNICC